MGVAAMGVAERMLADKTECITYYSLLRAPRGGRRDSHAFLCDIFNNDFAGTKKEEMPRLELYLNGAVLPWALLPSGMGMLNPKNCSANVAIAAQCWQCMQ